MANLAPVLQALAHVPIIGEREDGNQEGQAGAGGMEWLKTLMAAGASKGEKAAEPFILASNLPPVPPRLVKRIQALEFTNMRDLLPDNMALAERAAQGVATRGHPLPEGDRLAADVGLRVPHVCGRGERGTPGSDEGAHRLHAHPHRGGTPQ